MTYSTYKNACKRAYELKGGAPEGHSSGAPPFSYVGLWGREAKPSQRVRLHRVRSRGTNPRAEYPAPGATAPAPPQPGQTANKTT